MSNINEKTELIMSDDFEKALISAAEVKNNNISLCKNRNKQNYAQFYELMLASRTDIQSILDTKKSHRSDDDNNKVKEFKKNVSSSYRQVCDLLVPENLEEGEISKIQKIVQKITTVIKFLDYLGDNRIDDEFKKSGISLSYEHMIDTEVFGKDYIKEQLTVEKLTDIILDLKLNGCKNVGEFMKMLNLTYKGQFDGKVASGIINTVLKG
jgi:hypothetical protein